MCGNFRSAQIADQTLRMSGVDACVKIRLTDREICDCRWLKNGFVYGIMSAGSLACQVVGRCSFVLCRTESIGLRKNALAAGDPASRLNHTSSLTFSVRLVIDTDVPHGCIADRC